MFPGSIFYRPKFQPIIPNRRAYAKEKDILFNIARNVLANHRSAHDGRWHQSRLVQEALVEQCPIKRCCQATSGLKHSRWQKSEIHPLLKHIARERLASPALDNKHGLVVDTIRFTSLR